VTLTTLGYGDLVPITPLGYIIGGVCALTGLVFLAMPIPVVVNNFATFYAHAKARKSFQKNSKNTKKADLVNRAVALKLLTGSMMRNEMYNQGDVDGNKNSKLCNLTFL